MVMMIETMTLTKTIFSLRTTAYDYLVYIPWKSQKPKSLTRRLLRGLVQLSHSEDLAVDCEGLGVGSD